MGRTISEVLPLFQCAHEFSWPRKLQSGDYYQVCLRCGAEYGYDWATMRRTGRVARTTAAVQGRVASPKVRGTSWKPRSRRLAVELPVQYRQSASEAWIEGTVRNVSQSGVLFVTEGALPTRNSIELIFEMPEEISGQRGSRVICTGTIVRRTPGKENEPSVIAVCIAGYEFMHERKLPRAASFRA